VLDVTFVERCLLGQMPQLKPEDTTMIGLTLFNQLCQLARIANASLDNPLSDEQVLGL